VQVEGEIRPNLCFRSSPRLIIRLKQRCLRLFRISGYKINHFIAS